MNIISICGFVLVAAGMSVILKKKMPEYSMMINIISGVIIITAVLIGFVPIINQIKNLFLSTKISNEYISILFKCLGICILTQFCSDTCKDAGESALSSKVEFAGKIAVIIAALPLFEKVISTALILAGK